MLRLKERLFRLSELSDVVRDLLDEIVPGAIICLYGSMGAGKTTLVRAICDEYGRVGCVSSPTFSLVNVYEGVPPIYHMDLYRLTSEMDVLGLDLERYFLDSTALSFVEWPERLGRFKPSQALDWYLEHASGSDMDVRVLRRLA